MRENRRDILITIILLICFAGLLTFNVINSEIFEERIQARIERHNALQAQQQEKIAARGRTREFIRLRELARNQDIGEIIRFDEDYSKSRQEYLDEINRISDELDNKVVSIDDLLVLVDERIESARKFKDSLAQIDNIPEPLGEFYGLLSSFLDNDIQTWEQIRSYYSGTFNGDIDDIEELFSENSRLFQQVQELQTEIYTGYDLEDLL